MKLGVRYITIQPDEKEHNEFLLQEQASRIKHFPLCPETIFAVEKAGESGQIVRKSEPLFFSQDDNINKH